MRELRKEGGETRRLQRRPTRTGCVRRPIFTLLQEKSKRVPWAGKSMFSKRIILIGISLEDVPSGRERTHRR